MPTAAFRPVTDGVIALRAPAPGDAAILVAGRDDESRRWLGAGSEDPRPTACITVDGAVAGWIDYDTDRDWLGPGEVNVGYGLFAARRGHGCATRAVQLLMHHLATSTTECTATLLIHPENHASLAIAARARFEDRGMIDGSRYFTRPVPPLTYTDGVVTIRRLTTDDLDADLEAKDDEQIDWLWLPGQRETWTAMSPEEQRTHALRGLRAVHESFGAGPKWCFAVDAPDAPYVAYVDADLANGHVPAGDANISYSAHPSYRGRGYTSRGVRLVTRFLLDHTGARAAHVIVDRENAASLRVARSVGAAETERWENEHGRTMIRHVLALAAGQDGGPARRTQ